MNEDYEEKIIKEYERENMTDFMVKLYRGGIVPLNSPYYNEKRVEIEIYGCRLNEIDDSLIQIEGKNYKISSQDLLNNIKEYISKNLDTLIKWSLHQDELNLNENAYEGGMGRTIKIKYGNLTILVNGQVFDIGEKCDKFIDDILKIITTDSNNRQ